MYAFTIALLSQELHLSKWEIILTQYTKYIAVVRLDVCCMVKVCVVVFMAVVCNCARGALESVAVGLHRLVSFSEKNRQELTGFH